ncbi:MAG: hypothetical protein NDI60_01600 [Elusimicrobiales bacterium]|nr:hypothetical protein [Elusimicrobiales bacterium]
MRPEDEIPEDEIPQGKTEEAGAAAQGEPQEEAVGAGEKGRQNYWWLALSFLFLFLAGGGYYAMTSMKTQAQKLVGGENYSQLSANSSVYSGGAGLKRMDNFFASDELDPLAAEAVASSTEAAGASGADLKLAAAGGGMGSGPSAGGTGAGPEQDPGAAKAKPRGSVWDALKSRLSPGASAGLGGQGGAGATKTVATRGLEAYQGGGAGSGKPSVQSETAAAGSPKKGAGGGVLDSLKGVFRASFYGARIASQDSAKGWIARSFDATPEYGTSLQYDEKMRAKLDKVNPNSIPKFLRDQDVSAAEAKTLASAEVGKPKLDAEGTREALKNDKDYQARKAAQEMAGAAMNPLGNLVGGNTGRSGVNTARGDTEDAGFQGFSSPEDEAEIKEIITEQGVKPSGNGEECGCSASAPCCCLAPSAATGNCPMYGPFLPNDPCGAGFTTGPVGDFPPSNTTTMWV